MKKYAKAKKRQQSEINFKVCMLNKTDTKTEYENMKSTTFTLTVQNYKSFTLMRYTKTGLY